MLADNFMEMGGNAVSNFEVAQSGHHWLFTASILMWDSESLHGVGQAKLIPKDLMKEALGK